MQYLNTGLRGYIDPLGNYINSDYDIGLYEVRGYSKSGELVKTWIVMYDGEIMDDDTKEVLWDPTPYYW